MATALASSVFPVPGAPYKRMPGGGGGGDEREEGEGRGERRGEGEEEREEDERGGGERRREGWGGGGESKEERRVEEEWYGRKVICSTSAYMLARHQAKLEEVVQVFPPERCRFPANSSGCCNGSWMVSSISCLASHSPPTSSHSTQGIWAQHTSGS